MVGLIILFTGLMALLEALPKMFHPELADYSWATIVVVILAIFTKLALGIYVRQSGKRYNSSSLAASGIDALFDALISLATLVGIIVTMLFQISIDGLLGVIISLFIMRTSAEIILQATGDILGRTADRCLMQKIKAEIREFAGVKNAYDLMLHNYGPADLIGSVQIEVPDHMTAKEIHRLILKISNRIYAKFGIMLTISIYAESVD